MVTTRAFRATRNSRSGVAGPSAKPLATIANVRSISEAGNGEVVRQQGPERGEPLECLLHRVLDPQEPVQCRNIMGLEGAKAHGGKHSSDEPLEPTPTEVGV